jgi:hypothetical protein
MAAIAAATASASLVSVASSPVTAAALVTVAALLLLHVRRVDARRRDGTVGASAPLDAGVEVEHAVAGVVDVGLVSALAAEAHPRPVLALAALLLQVLRTEHAGRRIGPGQAHGREDELLGVLRIAEAHARHAAVARVGQTTYGAREGSEMEYL